MTIKYSICATHYNNNEYIRDSVGVLAYLIEGHSDWELVITDAGSNDGSLSYLRTLSEEQDNVRVVVNETINIGEGRQLAAEEARGKILVQVMDLDAEYYKDERIFKIVSFYEELIEQESDIMLGGGLNICTKSLLNELGGWKSLPANEETEIKRRALKQNKLRFISFELFKHHGGDGKSLSDAIDRFYYNSMAKFQAGVGFWHMVWFWLKNAPGIKPKVGSMFIFPFAYVRSKWGKEQIKGSYDRDDNYLIGFKSTVYRKNP